MTTAAPMPGGLAEQVAGCGDVGALAKVAGRGTCFVGPKPSWTVLSVLDLARFTPAAADGTHARAFSSAEFLPLDITIPRRAASGGGGGSRHALSTSFIKRCWFRRRGCLESSTCSNLRELFKTKEMRDELPLNDKMCQMPIYIVRNARVAGRNGLLDDHSHIPTMLYPGEKWYKCCKKKAESDGESDKLICQDVNVIPALKVIEEFNGWCGQHKCENPRDRCLQLGTQEEFVKEAKKGECPHACGGGCKKTTFHLECIFTGTEPRLGTEGKSTSTANQFGDPPEPYQVIALNSMPRPLALVPPPPHWVPGALASSDPRDVASKTQSSVPRPVGHTRARHCRLSWTAFLAL